MRDDKKIPFHGFVLTSSVCSLWFLPVIIFCNFSPKCGLFTILEKSVIFFIQNRGEVGTKLSTHEENFAD